MLDMSKDNNRFEEMGKESQFQKRKKKRIRHMTKTIKRNIESNMVLL